MSETLRTQEKYPRFVEDQRAFFDELITREWASYRNPAWDYTRRFEVARLLERIAPQRIVDVGCGCGFHDREMAQSPVVTEVLGIDYSAKSIEVAEQAYPHPKVTRRVADIREMAEGGFDLAVSFQVIEHLSDTEGFLRACAAQVRPCGWVVAATPNSLRLSNRVRRFFGKRIRLSDPQHYAEYTPLELEQIGCAAGLDYVGWFGYGLTLTVPFWRHCLLPYRLATWLGYRLPALADCYCMIFSVPDR